MTQAISNLSAIERNCWLQILRGIQKNKDLPDGDPKKYELTLTRSQLLECVSGHSSNLDYAFNALKNITDSKRYSIQKMDTVFMPVYCLMWMNILIMKPIL